MATTDSATLPSNIDAETARVLSDLVEAVQSMRRALFWMESGLKAVLGERGYVEAALLANLTPATDD